MFRFLGNLWMMMWEHPCATILSIMVFAVAWNISEKVTEKRLKRAYKRKLECEISAINKRNNVWQEID